MSSVRLLACAGVWLHSLAALPARAQGTDPSKAEVPLPALNGWNASLVLDTGSVGIWTVGAFDFNEPAAGLEVVGLDDLGRLHLLTGYSGKWAPQVALQDGKWLGGLAWADVDPAVNGNELYVGSQSGNVYQVKPRLGGAADVRRVAEFPGREVHTIVGGDLDPARPGPELLVFTFPGGLYRIAPSAGGKLETALLQELPARVRDVQALPGKPGEPPDLLTVSRGGRIELLRLTAEGPRWTLVHEQPVGFSRLARQPGSPDAAPVFYAGVDDGRVIRFGAGADGGWKVETIYAGPQGVRGVVAGRFHEDRSRETVAAYGYGGQVDLLSRSAGGAWSVETIFRDRAAGHWLISAEMDGRNGTEEILGSGYGGRIFLLARPPGYGLRGPATLGAPAAPPTSRSAADEDGPPPIRVAVRAGAVAATGLSPLSYRGGFETKTALYETLVRRDDRGRIVPGLAESWEARDGGRTWSFRIRKGARFHDGKPVDAESVRVHFHRWVGLPEHAWIGASERIREVAAVAPDVIEVRLDRPYYLLADLLAVNPGAVRGPGALDREGTFLAPVGTGPFRWIDAAADGGRLCLARFDPTRPWRLDLVRFEPTAGPEPLLEALRAGELDVVCDTWHERIPRDAFAALAADPKYRTMTGPGSSVWHLRLRGRDGPTADVAVRRAIAAAIDRAELIRAVESGHADPCTGLFAPSIADWPPGAAPAPASAAPPAGTTLRVRLGGTRGAPAGLEETLVAQLRKAGFAVEPLAAPAEPAAGGDRRRARDQADVWLARSYGVPYDPDLQLRAMFRPPTGNPSALGERPESLDPGLSALVGELQEEVREEARRDLYRKIQARADEQALVIPLYAPRRLAVLRAEVDGLRLDHDIYAIDLTGLRRRAEGRSE